MNVSESIFQRHLWSLLLTTPTDKKQGKNTKNSVSPFIPFSIYSDIHLLLWCLQFFPMLYSTLWSRLLFPLSSFVFHFSSLFKWFCLSSFFFSHFLPFNFNIQWHDPAVFLLHLWNSKMHGPEELRKKKKQKSKSNYLIIISFLKKNLSIWFSIWFFLPWLLLYERPRQTTKPGKIKEPSEWNGCSERWMNCDLWQDKDQHHKLSAVAISRYSPDHPHGDKDRGIFKL